MIGSTIFYEKKKPPVAAKLSLISLMDIFTILVFFLLLNSGESQEIENAKFVELPDSSSGVAPHTDLRITVGDEQIMLNERVIASVDEVLESSKRVIDSLAAELNANTEQLGDLSPYEKNVGLAVTIMGDRTVSYSLLKRVMTTCQQSNYRNISLAVNSISESDPQALEPDELEGEGPPAEPAPTSDAVTFVGEDR